MYACCERVSRPPWGSRPVSWAGRHSGGGGLRSLLVNSGRVEPGSRDLRDNTPDRRSHGKWFDFFDGALPLSYTRSSILRAPQRGGSDANQRT
jgi:hypothetical protein